MRIRFFAASASLAFCAIVLGCGGGSGSNSPFTGGPTSGGGSVPSSRHVVVVMEENQIYASVVGNALVWPNLNKLMMQGALATNYYANTHYSIGNYFMLTTGQILTRDDNSRQIWNVDSIARRMISAGVSFKIYAEGATQGYTGGNTGQYVLRHNPFALLSDVADSPTTARKYIWPFTQLASDIASNALPQFSFIIPSIANDAHSGPPTQADAWLQSKVVGPISGTPAFKAGGDGILAVLYDESIVSDTANGGGHVAALFWGPLVKPGYRQSSKTVYQHQSMLATWMAALDLPNPPGQAANAPVMSEFFVQK
ncbi:alkaline phosphatase family protein [Occallatibacter riparius]|uniref:Alkaline phosphatase family protein n=1 Tax=Occallatibacter riparius TaxID=1002689 RepID=A0A9J7BMZ1_9BACT|nr:alkaline phosphatase family protein [Occallatibacter riparius]UWZ82549.1 alkaline phosphatase family protein [Occallatibacter riparius]